jgi:hypothetical protein
LTGTFATAKKTVDGMVKKRKWELRLTPVEAAHTMVTPRKSNLKGFDGWGNDL